MSEPQLKLFAPPAPVGVPVVWANGLTKEYVVGRHRARVVNGLNFTFREREITAVTGPSGSGKTTLLRMIGGLSKPTAGTISVRGQDLYALSDSQLSRYRNREIGFVFQDYRLLPNYNAIENAMMGLVVSRASKREQRQGAKRALRMVGLGQLANQRVDRMSGGQQQRVGIARALAMGPSVLIADEPTGNLDQASGAGIMSLFHRLRNEEGLSIVLVTHDERLADEGDHLIRLVDGRVQEDSRGAD